MPLPLGRGWPKAGRGVTSRSRPLVLESAAMSQVEDQVRQALVIELEAVLRPGWTVRLLSASGSVDETRVVVKSLPSARQE